MYAILTLHYSRVIDWFRNKPTNYMIYFNRTLDENVVSTRAAWYKFTPQEDRYTSSVWMSQSNPKLLTAITQVINSSPVYQTVNFLNVNFFNHFRIQFITIKGLKRCILPLRCSFCHLGDPHWTRHTINQNINSPNQNPYDQVIINFICVLIGNLRKVNTPFLN